ncbi:hypothetical protein HFO91_30960 [Rhizobium leguminosarum]|uniref:hypothetical protein n=1 Tax=Rhizobium leguminosarum TaxID=384 RepID=UPI001C966D80|nr:hypothetical protein [Rhizobium leguminosarum]MBY5371207.1 hypothetical protein [Rhizobium leguminosarum]MBY5454002.1 hypothetical protein [Rhizobium leguminosarum]
MIRFVKKSDPQPAAHDAGESAKKIREAAAEGLRKAPTTAPVAARRRRRKMTTRLSEHSAAQQFTT